MYSRDPVWLLPEQLLEKYEDFCFYNNITERRLVKLFDAFLLRGRDNRKTRKVEILQESFEDLQDLIIYNLKMKAVKEEPLIKPPDYLKNKYPIFYDGSLNWYTPKDLLEKYSKYLKYERTFNVEFIGELAQMGAITGKYQQSENCYHILLRSFVWMMKYREHSVSRYFILPPPNDPQA